MESGQQETENRPTATKPAFDWRYIAVAIIALGVGFGAAWFIAAKVNGKKAEDKDGTAKEAPTAFALATTADSISYAYGVSQCPYDDDIKTYLLSFKSDAKYIDDFFAGMEDGLLTPDDDKAIAYQAGYHLGLNTKFNLRLGAASLLPEGSKISMAGVVKGIKDVRGGSIDFLVDGRNLSRDEIDEYLRSISMRSQQKAADEKQLASEAYIEEMAEQPGVHVLEDGVLYRVIEVGEGPVPTNASKVEIKYTSKLESGKVVDSSHDKSIVVEVKKLIPGFATALCHMPVGSEWEVYVPWQMAYGEKGDGPIPPYSVLIFNVKLLNIK